MATKKQLTRSPEADKRKIIDKKEYDQLFQALAVIKKKKQISEFLKSLFTSGEIRNIARRFEVVMLLNNNLTYEEIKFQLKNVGFTTIARMGQRFKQNPKIFHEIINHL